jgi:hypothetical protein
MERRSGPLRCCWLFIAIPERHHPLTGSGVLILDGPFAEISAVAQLPPA